MNMRLSMGIKTKMTLLTAIPLGLLVVIISINIFYIEKLSDKQNNVDRQQETVNLIQSLEKSIDEMTILTKTKLTRNDEVLSAHYDTLETQFHQNITTLLIAVTEQPQQVRRIEELDNLTRNWSRQTNPSLTPQVSSDSFGFISEFKHKLNRIEILEAEKLQAKRSEFILHKRQLKQDLLLGSILTIIISFLTARMIKGSISAQLKNILSGLEQLAQANYSKPIPITGKDEIGKLGIAANKLLGILQSTTTLAKNIALGNYEVVVEPRSEDDELSKALQNMTSSLVDHEISIAQRQTKLEKEYWIKSTYTEIVGQLQSMRNLKDFGDKLLATLVPALDAEVGIFYHTTEDENIELFDDTITTSLNPVTSYSLSSKDDLSKVFQLGEGVVGQCGLERKTILLSKIPNDYLKVRSGSINSSPKQIIVFPIEFEDNLLSVIEIGSLAIFALEHQSLIKLLQKNIGVIINNIISKSRTEAFLSQAQYQGRELLEQKEELMLVNINLEEQKKNLAMASQYKSEFLANMSHELRTPLNSLLVLSKKLAKNKEGNMNTRQKESARIIHSGGNELLELINDILDLSKVESGKMSLHVESAVIDEIITNLRHKFEPLAQEKDFRFVIHISENVPKTFETDAQRTLQVLKNLLSNAFKFTQQGTVAFRIFRPNLETTLLHEHLNHQNCIGFSVSDSGIGIPKEKQKLIFEAFRQADGSTNRDFGGTGLGLTITREMCRLLGGELHISSALGDGSTFTVYFPLCNDGQHGEKQQQEFNLVSFVEHQLIRNNETQADESLIEKGITNKEQAVKTQDKEPVFELQKNKQLPSETPADDSSTMSEGTYLAASVDSPQKLPEEKSKSELFSHTVLLVDDNMRNIFALAGDLEECGLTVKTAENGERAIERLENEDDIELVMMDMLMPIMDGYDAIRHIRSQDKFKNLPVIALTAQAMSDDRDKCINAGANEYMKTPVDTDQLLCLIKETLSKNLNNSLH